MIAARQPAHIEKPAHHQKQQAISLFMNQILAAAGGADPIVYWWNPQNDKNNYQLQALGIGETYYINDAITELEQGLSVNQTLESFCQAEAHQSLCEKLLPQAARLSTQALGNYILALEAIRSMEFEHAETFLQAVLTEHPDYELARLMLAESLYERSQLIQSLAEAESLIQNGLSWQVAWFAQHLKCKILLRNAQLDLAETEARSLIKLTPTDSLTLQAQSLLILGNILKEKEDYITAVQTAESLLSQLPIGSIPLLRANAFGLLGDAQFGLGLLEQAKKAFISSAEIYNQLQWTFNYDLGGVYASLALISEYQGRYNESLAFIQRRAQLVAINNDPIKIAGVSLHLASVYIELGQFDQAFKQADKVWQIAAKHDVPVAKLLAEYMLGLVEQARGHFQVAEQHLKQSMQLAVDLDTPHRFLNSQNALVDLFLQMKKYDQAETEAKQMLENAVQEKSALYQAAAQLQLAIAHRYTDNSEISRQHLAIARSLSEKLEHDSLSYDILFEELEWLLSDDPETGLKRINIYEANHQEDFNFWLMKARLTQAMDQNQQALVYFNRSKSLAKGWWGEPEEAMLEAAKNTLP